MSLNQEQEEDMKKASAAALATRAFLELLKRVAMTMGDEEFSVHCINQIITIELKIQETLDAMQLYFAEDDKQHATKPH